MSGAANDDGAEFVLAGTVADRLVSAYEDGLGNDRWLSADGLRATLNAVGEGIIVRGPDGRLLLANEAAAAMLGYSSVAGLLAAGPGEALARFELLDDAGQPLTFANLPGRAALRGEPMPEVLVRWRVAGTGAEHFSLVAAHPVHDEGGSLQFVVSVFRDVTERQRTLRALRASEARLAFLASASHRLLVAPLDPVAVLAVVADLFVPDLADWCIVQGMDEHDGLSRIAARQRDNQDAAQLASLLSEVQLLAGPKALAALRDGHAILLAEIDQDPRAGADAESLALLGRHGVRTVMVVPVRTRQRTVGVLTLGGNAARAPYGDDDLALAEEVVARVGPTVDNALAFSRERSTAETLTRALLPGRLPDIPGIELAARYRAAGEVGGDFYDCFPIGDDGWMLVVGDVCGRGIHAATMTGVTRHSIRAAAQHASSPAGVLADLNRLLLEAAGEDMAAWRSGFGDEPSFCTVCLVAVHPQCRGARGSVAVAGHPLPFLVRGSGQATEVGRPGSLLGVVANFDASDEHFELGPGDALVLFTDGITERRDRRRFFDEDLPALLGESAGMAAPALACRVEEAAVAFSETPPDDDMAVVVLSVPAVGDPTNGDRPQSAE